MVKNPLSPVEQPGGVGVNCELFELGVEQFVVSGPDSTVVHFAVLIPAIADCISAELIELCEYQACWHTGLITSMNLSLGFGMHTAQRPSAEVEDLERAVAVRAIDSVTMLVLSIERLHHGILVRRIDGPRGHALTQPKDTLDHAQLRRRCIHTRHCHPIIHDHPCAHNRRASIHATRHQRNLQQA